jgi:hypothetical protein
MEARCPSASKANTMIAASMAIAAAVVTVKRHSETYPLGVNVIRLTQELATFEALLSRRRLSSCQRPIFLS